ncbi:MULTISPECIES: IS256 family transposase [Methylobacterium]|uniref:IS256 family transposase n=1 Tax=Methylobacterium TaxID=407 RepID=UPI002484AE0C|nr:transposase [Methylobacterium sp. DB0501]
MCLEIDECVNAFLERPIKGERPYPWIDATYVKVRQNHRIVSAAVIMAVGVNTDGRREALGFDIGPSEAETFWTAFLRKLAWRGLRGVKLVISDAHDGIKASVAKVMTASWQRCRAHFMRNVLAHAGHSGRRVVSAFTTAFAQDDAEAARLKWRRVGRSTPAQGAQAGCPDGRGRGRRPGLHELPNRPSCQAASTNPLERLNGEINRRTEVVGIFPDEPAIRRLVGALLLEQDDEWAVQRCRTMTLDNIAPIDVDTLVSLPTLVRLIRPALPVIVVGHPQPHHALGHDPPPWVTYPLRPIQRLRVRSRPHGARLPCWRA